MSWKKAFLAQARSDYAVLQRLSNPPSEYCHRLHYLQMTTEKLAKAWLIGRDDEAPTPTHIAFSRMVQTLKMRPDVRRALRFVHTAAYKRFLNSLLELAVQIEKLAPVSAGMEKPNPEYPWKDITSGTIVAPADFAFPDLDWKNPKMQKIDALIRHLLRIAS